MAFNMFTTPQLTKPVGVYDPNQGWRGKPAAENIVASQRTPQVQLQNQQQTQPSTNAKGVVTPIDSNSSTAGMDYLNSLYTSPQEEERLRKASVMNQRILAIGDAIRHIGNIANTVNYAPAQQLNSPVQEEYARYQQGKALRDRANQQFYTYQQQKAAQDAAQRKWEQQFNYNLAKDERTFKYNAARDAANLAEKKRQADQNYNLNVRKADDAKERAEADRKLRDTISRRSNSLGWANHKLAKEKFNYQKANGGGNGRRLPEILHGIKGTYTKNMTANELKQLYNQTYDEFEKRGIIKRDDVLAGLPADIFGRKTLSEAAKREAVDRILMQNGEVGDWIEENYETIYNPRAGYGDGSMLQQQQQNNGLFSAPWNNNRGNPFDDRQQSSGSINNHKSNPFG